MFKLSVLGLIAAVVASGLMHGEPAEATKESTATASLGVYDPTRDYHRVDRMAIEHVFIPWQSFDQAELRQTVRYAGQRGRQMLVTLEPWTKAPDWRDGGDTLFSDILAGGYDDAITASCTEIGRMDGLVMVRWGHEMEEVTGRYPWARHDSAGYIEAYRYFVSACREIAPRARFVWSPIGHEPLKRYYPGDAYVDIVGIPVWGYQKADRLWYGSDRSLSDAVREKYVRVSGYNKPVIIAELGVVGSRAYQAEWLSGLESVRKAFPLINSVVYYNRKEPAEWPNGLGKPDWRVGPQEFASLSEKF